MENCNSSNKRGLDYSELNSPESKRVRTGSDVNPPELKPLESDSDSPELEQAESEANRVDSDHVEFHFFESSSIRDDILGMLDDEETVPDRDPTIQNLDSVIKSFEEEIFQASPPPQATVIDLSSYPAESRPDLGYLLKASDDDLGLPPAISPFDEQQRNESINSVGIPPEAISVGFENYIPSFDSFELGISEATHSINDGGYGEFVTVGGLFDYSEPPSDFSEFLLQSESLPAI